MPTKMMCPKYCKTELQKVKVKKVEVDQCPNCEGVWFDSKGDELLAVLREGYPGAPESLKKSWDAGGGTLEPSKPHRYNCPRCGHELSTYTYAGQFGGFDIDGCRQGCGIWLDDGELEGAFQTLRLTQPAALKQGRSGVFERILSFLTARQQ